MSPPSPLPTKSLTLSPGQNVTFVVTFTPTAVGMASETITITSSGAPLTIPLTGAVMQGDLSIKSQDLFPRFAARDQSLRNTTLA